MKLVGVGIIMDPSNCIVFLLRYCIVLYGTFPSSPSNLLVLVHPSSPCNSTNSISI